MYAVIKAGGKQQKVKAGDVIEVELMHGGHDEDVTFAPILVVDDDGKTHFGKELAKAAVTARLVGQKKGEKIDIFKYRAKTGYAKRQGHRQMYTLVEIRDVTLGKRGAARQQKKDEAPKAEPEAETPAAATTAPPAAEAEAPAAEVEAPGAEAETPVAEAETPAAEAEEEAPESEPGATAEEASGGE